jgi:very-short-patch-repair endonuclease
MLTEPFLGSAAVRAGLLTAGRLRGPRYVRVFTDVYLPAGVELTFEMRSRAAYLLVRERGGMLAGYSAAALHGASCEPRGAPAEVLVPVHVKPQPGLLVHQGDCDEREIAGGVAVTSRLRTAWDLGRRLTLPEAVVAVDALARPKYPGEPPYFDPFVLLDRRLAEPGARNCLRLDRVVALADPRSESPPETRMRLRLVLAELRPDVQYELRTEYGAFVARVDLAFPRARLAIEYDSDEHDDALDRARDIRIGALGWHVMRFQARDLYLRPDRMVDAVRQQVEHRTKLIVAERLAVRR